MFDVEVLAQAKHVSKTLISDCIVSRQTNIYRDHPQSIRDLKEDDVSRKASNDVN